MEGLQAAATAADAVVAASSADAGMEFALPWPLNREMEWPRNRPWCSFGGIMNLPNIELLESTILPAGETIPFQKTPASAAYH